MSVMRAYVGTTPTITDTIRDADGDPVNLTGATVDFYVKPPTGGPIIFNSTIDPDQTTHRGQVAQPLDVNFTGSRGTYETWWHVVFAGGTILETDESVLVLEEHVFYVDPTAGPCSAWCSSEDVAILADDQTIDYSTYALIASELLYLWSGRQFPGDCTRSVRPSRATCSCWSGAWFRPAWVTWDLWNGRWWGGESWQGLDDGCSPLSRVLLPGYVRSVTSVRINGLVVDPTWYRVDFNRELVALLDDDGLPFTWPGCQDMRLGSGDSGAFAVEYVWGHATPASGRAAAARLALELYRGDHGGKCALPTSVVRLVRQGVTIERDRQKPDTIGLPTVDAFLAAFNPTRARRAPVVWSPDQTRTPRRIG